MFRLQIWRPCFFFFIRYKSLFWEMASVSTFLTTSQTWTETAASQRHSSVYLMGSEKAKQASKPSNLSAKVQPNVSFLQTTVMLNATFLYVTALHFFRFNFEFYAVTTPCLWSGQRQAQKPLGQGQEQIMFWLTRFCHHKHSQETVLTSRRKYLILWPLTWLETVMIFPKKILFFVTTNRVGKWRHIPSKISCFVVTNMDGKKSRLLVKNFLFCNHWQDWKLSPLLIEI